MDVAVVIVDETLHAHSMPGVATAGRRSTGSAPARARSRVPRLLKQPRRRFSAGRLNLALLECFAQVLRAELAGR